MTEAPVAMFVYNRADNTRKTMEALLANTLARRTRLYVFSDGGKDRKSWAEVKKLRGYLHEVKERAERQGLLRSMTIVEREENLYIERNITEGIAQMFGDYERVVVLEDDIVTGKYFLEYMNEALEMYADEPRVMHVSGFTNQSLNREKDYYFTPHMSGWGWATWREKWNRHFRPHKDRAEALEGMSTEDMNAMQYGGVFPCLRSLDKRPIPWDICWELAIYKAGGLCLTPCHTMVRNVGLSGGTHFRSCPLLQHYEYDREPLQRRLRLEKEDAPAAEAETERLFAQAITDWGIRYTPLGKAVRYIYKKVRR